jgi:hypothetical protein
MAKIVLEGVTKIFGSDVYAVDDVSLEIGDGEFMAITLSVDPSRFHYFDVDSGRAVAAPVPAASAG